MMKAVKSAIAGSLESSDVLVTVTPVAGDGVEYRIESLVMQQFGRRIRAVAEEVASSMGLSGAHLRVQDRGALEYTIRARIETAIQRATA